MNEQVLKWKVTTLNLQLERAHVEGKIQQIYPERNGHAHFEIRIGAGEKDTLEVVYQESFGQLPELKAGDVVEACGDYITSNAATDQYPASPDGAIIHWVHQSKSPRHDSGFVIVNGKRFGDLHGGSGGGRGGHGKGSSKPVPISEIEFQDPASCYELANTHVILNPNFGKSGKPFKNYYGFLFDGKNVFKIVNEKDTTAIKGPSYDSFADFYSHQLGLPVTTNGCPSEAVGAPMPPPAR